MLLIEPRVLTELSMINVVATIFLQHFVRIVSDLFKELTCECCKCAGQVDGCADENTARKEDSLS